MGKAEANCERTGNRYGDWEIISTHYIMKKGKPYFMCRCHCPVCERNDEIATEKYVLHYYLQKGLSLGCLRGHGHRLMTTNNPSVRKLNEYDLSGDYGVGYINSANGQFAFKFDLEDYDKISKYTWHISKAKDGYARTIIRTDKRHCHQITMHRLILGLTDWNEQQLMADHINHDTHDNRKSNLRVCTAQENSLNKKICSAKLGHGVTMQDGKWLVRFRRNNKKYYGGLFDSYEDAMKVRLQMEPESEFSYIT